MNILEDLKPLRIELMRPDHTTLQASVRSPFRAAGPYLGSILVVSLISPGVALSAEERTPITHGVMVGDVTHERAVIWSRSDREATLHVWLQAVGGSAPLHAQGRVLAADDFTGKLLFQGLKPDTEYQYAVRFGGDSSVPRHDPVSGSFRTAPLARSRKDVHFMWGGDLAGQNTCRDAQEGFPIFPVISRSKADFFVATGNMIHADTPCDQVGNYGNKQIPLTAEPARTVDGLWTRWKYTRLDRGLQEFVAKTPYFPVWNDHEVIDKLGPLHDSHPSKTSQPAEHLLPLGLAAFLDYNPLVTDSDRPLSLYRSFRWGQHAELFLLDTRQYRDSNFADDKPERPKTMLGREQLSWLKNRLAASDATWKFIVSSVPLAALAAGPQDRARDGWANGEQKTGFERELTDLVSFMKGEGLKNIVWLTGDTHAAQGLRFQPFGKDSPFIMYEFAAGPLNATLTPSRALDQTLQPERLFFLGPETPASVHSFSDAKNWMNAGVVEISDTGALLVRILNAAGKAAWTSDPLLPR
jgi:alkaline phosphatase D